MSKDKEEGLMNVLNNLSTDDESDCDLNKGSAEIARDEDISDSEHRDVQEKNSKKEKQKLGLGPKIAMVGISILCAYGYLTSDQLNKGSSNLEAAPEIEQADSNKHSATKENDTEYVLAEEEKMIAPIEATHSVANVTNDENKNEVSEEESSSIKLDLDELGSISDTSYDNEANEIISGLSELEDISISSPNELETGVSLGSVVTEEDLNSIRDQLSIQVFELQKIKDLYIDEISALKPEIAMLKSLVEKKKYDLSWEKDRPEISSLIISRPLTNCETCIAHASWIYDGVRVQKGHKSKWMGFQVTLVGDKLNLAKNEASYDYWSTKNSY